MNSLSGPPRELWTRKGFRIFTITAAQELKCPCFQIGDYAEYLGATYPDRVKTTVIGYSVEGRPIRAVNINTGFTKKPGIIIDAGNISRVLFPTSLLLRFVSYVKIIC